LANVRTVLHVAMQRKFYAVFEDPTKPSCLEKLITSYFQGTQFPFLGLSVL